MAIQSDPPRVLVVDDERSVADVFAEHLEPAFAVETAYSDTEAVTALDREPDIVLLDRQMPELHGETVLETIEDRDLDLRVAMVTAIEPDFDVIDTPIDDYLVKPVDEDELLETVRGLVGFGDLADKKKELSSKKLKRNVLEIEKRPRELAEHDDFQRLEARIEQLEAEIAAMESESAGEAD